MNKNALVTAIISIIGLILALVLGNFVARESYGNLGIIFAGVALLVLCLTLLKNVWVLIPLCASLIGTIGISPIPLQVNEIAILIAVVMFVVLSAMRTIPKFPRLNTYDKLLFLNLAYLVTVYARNPAGLLVFETEIIGGRPYFAIFIALLGYWVLQHVTLKPKQAALIPVLACVGSIASTLISAITAIFPGLAYNIYPIYTGVTLEGSADPMAITREGENRKGYLSGYARTVGSAMVAFRDPTRLLLFLSPVLALLFISAIIAALLSGFRSGWAFLVAMTAISVYFRAGLGRVLRIGLILLAGLLIAILCQSAGFELPLPAQRALSFLPGQWDTRVVGDAQSSNEWRFEMWRQALTNERYIRNKLLGDGFGFRAVDMQGFQSMGGMQATSSEQLQDYFLVVGVYHSGPISAIRFVGAVGLLLLTVFMIACARYAWKLVIRSKETPFFIMALFVCSPVIYLPFEFYFVAAGTDSAYPGFILNLAFLNMLARSLKAYEGGRAEIQNLKAET